MTQRGSTAGGIPVMVSIDTEEDNWLPTRVGITVENIRELPKLAVRFRELGVRPTYFTTHAVARERRAAAILRDISHGGVAEIGAHLHPWNTPPLDEPLQPRNVMLKNLKADLQRDKLRTLTRVISDAFGTVPASFRAGRFGLGAETIRALVREGYQVDSSVTPYVDWSEYDDGANFVGAPVYPYRLGVETSDVRVPAPGGEILEMPISTGYTRFGPRQWTRAERFFSRPAARTLRLQGIASRAGLMTKAILSPETNTVRQMLALSRRLLDGGAPHLHVFFHSPSLRPGLTPFTATAGDVERLYAALDAYLDGLSAMTSPHFATVREAAALLHRPPPAPAAAPARRPRLLVVSYHFPPDGAVGGLRWGGLTKHLAADGWDVRVVTAAPGASEAAPPGVGVVSCARGLTLRDVYRKLARVERRPPNEAPERAGTTVPESRLVRWYHELRHEGAVLLAIPDSARGWVRRAAPRARAIVHRFGPDVVVSSGPPHTVHLVAWLATMGTKVRWLVDLRDPWVAPDPDLFRTGAWLRGLAGRAILSWLERTLFRAADGVITNTPELAAAVSQWYPDIPMVWLRNGIDRDRLPANAGPPFPGCGLSYVGTLYLNRRLTPILLALRALLDREPETTEPITLRIAGGVEPAHERELFREIADLRLAPHVERLGLLAPDEATRLLARSRLAIVLAQGQDLQVPAKLYESVALGVPTLVIAGEGSASAREGRALGAVVVDPHDVEGIVRVLARARANDPTLSPRPGNEIDYSQLARVAHDFLVNARGFLARSGRVLPVDG